MCEGKNQKFPVVRTRKRKLLFSYVSFGGIRLRLFVVGWVRLIGVVSIRNTSIKINYAFIVILFIMFVWLWITFCILVFCVLIWINWCNPLLLVAFFPLSSFLQVCLDKPCVDTPELNYQAVVNARWWYDKRPTRCRILFIYNGNGFENIRKNVNEPQTYAIEYVLSERVLFTFAQ